MLPGATNANYEIFGGTFLNDRPQSCTTLGGAVRISNNMLIPNSFVHFDEGSGGIDGFLGYMLTRTPIGKRSPTDNANYWTIIIDAANFSGPVMYMSAWFWDSRINWHPKSSSWSDPRALITYIAQGFEGSIGSYVLTDKKGGKWIRTNRIAFPRDDGSANTSTLASGHSQFNTDWAQTAMEPMLSGTGPKNSRTPAHVLQSYTDDRTKPDCNAPDQFSAWGLETDETDEEPETDIGGFGVGDVVPAAEPFLKIADKASCHTRLQLSVKKLQCTSSSCETSKYIRQKKRGAKYNPLKRVPKHIQKALELLQFEPTRRNDGRYLGPPADTEQACFDTPGPSPADPRLYCTRTQSGTWLGFRWYRFVDQPELNQVFRSIADTAERDAARCFMQERIERLHAAAKKDGDEVRRWFDAPQGADALPKTKVGIDPALLVTPPKGLEVGFVPIPVFERNREASPDCEVFVGVKKEPNPLPEGYYEGYAYDGGDYEEEVCPANPESKGKKYTYPGTIFSYHPNKNQSARTGYKVPVRTKVEMDDAVKCGLSSDPP